MSTTSYPTYSLPLIDINDCEFEKMAEELTELRYVTYFVCKLIFYDDAIIITGSGMLF
jgi:hypothetical protein